MSTVTEEFRFLAKELSDFYQQRKELAKQIIHREDRLRQLGLLLEFADNMEEQLDDGSPVEVEE